MNANGQGPARRHHTVPKFYLRGFARGDQIETIRLPGTQRFIQSISDASVAKDFYSVEGHQDGPDAIEKALSELEGAAAEVFRHIEAGTWPLVLNERMTLGYFISLQAMRVPAQRRSSDHLAAQMLRIQIGASGKAALRRQLEERGGDVTDELVERVWDESIRAEGPPVQLTNYAHIQQMLDLSQTLHKYIVGRPWVLVKFDRRSLITSDAPVGLIADPGDDPHIGVGFATAWGITFPLTRKIGLLMASPEQLVDNKVPVENVHNGEFDIREVGTTRLEKLFNDYTVSSSNLWLFHHPDDTKFVPSSLPEPDDLSKRIMGTPKAFSGEPWFGPGTQATTRK